MKIVPRTSSVAHGDGQLDARDERPGEKTSTCVLTEAEASDQGRQNDKEARFDHLPELDIDRSPKLCSCAIVICSIAFYYRAAFNIYGF